MEDRNSYRKLFHGKNIEYFRAAVKQTDLQIGADRNLYDQAISLINICRKQIENHIKNNPDFLTSLTPLSCTRNSPYIVKKMCSASYKAGVGPMAAVAGAISEIVGTNLLKYSNEIIIENGGDIFIKSNIQRTISIYAGDSPLSKKLGLIVEPDSTPLGICTSSGKIGHSLNFGNADAVVIVSKNTALADATATAAANIVKTDKDINIAIDFAKKIDGVTGMIIIIDDKLGIWGDIKILPI